MKPQGDINLQTRVLLQVGQSGRSLPKTKRSKSFLHSSQ
jgi:hypothetical protein